MDTNCIDCPLGLSRLQILLYYYRKIQQYSPSDAAKVYEKSTTRRSNALFNPKTLQKLKQGTPPQYLDEEGRRDLIRQYIDVSIVFINTVIRFGVYTSCCFSLNNSCYSWIRTIRMKRKLRII